MKDQIEALRKLQEQDQKMVKIEMHLAAIPKRLVTMDKDLAQLEQLLTRETQKLEQSRTFRTRQERQLQDERDQLANSKQRLSEVQNAREHAAIQREIEATRRLSDTRATEITNIGTAITEAEQRIEKTESSLNELRTQFEAERVKLAARKEKLEAGKALYLEDRKSVTEGIPQRLLANYDRIRRRTPKDAFVSVRQQRCGGCNVLVPHQTYVALRRAEVIPNCESCGRLQFWSGLYAKEFELNPEDAGIPAAEPEPAAKKKTAKKRRTAPKKSAKKTAAKTDSRPLNLSPKPSPDKVIPNHMALDGEDSAGPALGPNSAPKPAPAPKNAPAAPGED